MEIEKLDPGIREAVIILNRYGFKTFESCEGGEGHCFYEPTIHFEGTEFDLIRAYDVCETHGLNVFEVSRVYCRTSLYPTDNEVGDGEIQCWDYPFNRIVFLKHGETGTIYRPR